MYVSDTVVPISEALVGPVFTVFRDPAVAKNIETLREENAALRVENARLEEWYHAALVLEAENQSLRDLVGLEPTPQTLFVPARVFLDTQNNYAKTLLITAGEIDGVRRGQAVVSGLGMVGRVIEVGRRTARVLLVTDINSRIPVSIEGTSLHAILAGKNDERPVLDYIPENSSVSEGAVIKTSGHGGLFPAGLKIGKVEEVVPGQDPVVTLFADLESLLFVRVIDRLDVDIFE